MLLVFDLITDTEASSSGRQQMQYGAVLYNHPTFTRVCINCAVIKMVIGFIARWRGWRLVPLANIAANIGPLFQRDFQTQARHKQLPPVPEIPRPS